MEPTPSKSGALKYIIGLVIVAVVIIGVSVASSKQSVPYKKDIQTPVTQISNTNTTDTTGTSEAKTFSLTDIATHSTKDSCYSAINGIVYDLTTWIYKHPGGANKILAICGKDGTSSFSKKHEGQPKPEEILAGFEIGTLTK